ncbi:MAG TPA: sugar ABC transporter permease [Clostridia bacterium]|nr:sugar ABC transporter permease [Clostridia bacterium]
MNKMLRDKKIISILILPGLSVFVFAVFLPIVLSIYYGMTSWSGIGKPEFIGLANFKELVFHDKVFWISLRNALLLATGYVLIQHPLCLTAAIMLDRIGGRLEKVFRAIFFIPCVISIVVTSRMWVGIYDPQYGLLNKVLDLFHLGFLKQEWLGNPKLVLWSLLIIIMWQGFGWGMLIYYAGIKGIPEELYEAARIDGASGLKLYTQITIPLLQPVIRINVTLAVIAALKQMETIYLTTNGGPGNTSQFLANYLYIKAFNSYEYGYGNAISVLFVIACLIATYLLNKLLKREAIEY